MKHFRRRQDFPTAALGLRRLYTPPLFEGEKNPIQKGEIVKKWNSLTLVNTDFEIWPRDYSGWVLEYPADIYKNPDWATFMEWLRSKAI